MSDHGPSTDLVYPKLYSLTQKEFHEVCILKEYRKPQIKTLSNSLVMVLERSSTAKLETALLLALEAADHILSPSLVEIRVFISQSIPKGVFYMLVTGC